MYCTAENTYASGREKFNEKVLAKNWLIIFSKCLKL